MISILLVIHVLLSLSIIGLVLLQRGKGADAGASLGGGSSGSVFGARGAANFLSRSTAVLATAFFITSLGLAYLSSNMQTGNNVANGSVIEQPAVLPDSDIPAALDMPPATSDVPAATATTPSATEDIPASDLPPATE
ncbi:Protein translocase membrane subunit SecG [hydrothermal vent metagenome]|uniref:Protein translocase membrane subunit SecG n=1 Tax=hydrothermal vent metagenome TaxID=652676 RepID=A0A3B0Y5L2_9ZZZZ